MALVYFQSSHGPHKIPSDKELDIQVWLTPPSFSLLLPADCLNTRFLGVPRLCAVSDHPLYIFVYLCVNYTLWRLGASIVGANCRFFRYSPLKLITLQSRIISIIGIYLKRPFLFFCRVSATISSITLFQRLPPLSPLCQQHIIERVDSELGKKISHGLTRRDDSLFLCNFCNWMCAKNTICQPHLIQEEIHPRSVLACPQKFMEKYQIVAGPETLASESVESIWLHYWLHLKAWVLITSASDSFSDTIALGETANLKRHIWLSWFSAEC